MRQFFLFLCFITIFLFSCTKKNDCEKCVLLIGSNITMTQDSFYTISNTDNWCDYINTVDGFEMTDAAGNPIGKAKKKCN
jgi:hypothetical protein